MEEDFRQMGGYNGYHCIMSDRAWCLVAAAQRVMSAIVHYLATARARAEMFNSQSYVRETLDQV